MKNFKELDPLLHSQLRLAIISVLVGVKEADFSYLLDITHATNGNLSVQIGKLKDAEYIEVKKSFENNHDLVYFTKDRKIIQKLKDIRAKFE